MQKKVCCLPKVDVYAVLSDLWRLSASLLFCGGPAAAFGYPDNEAVLETRGGDADFPSVRSHYMDSEKNPIGAQTRSVKKAFRMNVLILILQQFVFI